MALGFPSFANRFRCACAALALLLLSSEAQAFKIELDEDSFLTLGVLMQPHLLVNNQGPDWGSAQVYARRTRLSFGGQYKKLGFLLLIEQFDWGKNSNWKPSLTFQDAVAFIELQKDMHLDVGLFIFPLVRYFLQGAGAIHTLDYFIPAIPFLENSHSVYRDMGVQFRGFFLDDTVHLRASLSNGITANAPSGANKASLPRVAGMLRYNFLGSEKGYALSAIYFSKTPLMSVGMGFEYQPNAALYATPSNPAQKADSLSLAADFFVEYPFWERHALVAQANLFHYARGPQNPFSGTGAVLEVGWLIGKIEPILSWGYFNSMAPGHAKDVWSLRPGLNWWIDRHRFNLKAEAGWTGRRLQWNTKKEFACTVQLQVAL